MSAVRNHSSPLGFSSSPIFSGEEVFKAIDAS